MDAVPSGGDIANESESSSAAPTPSCEPEALYEEYAALLGSMAINGDYLYWMEGRSGALSRLAKQGGTPEHVAEGIETFVADAEHLYAAGLDENIHRIAFDGSENVVLAATGGIASSLQVVGPYLYWHSRSGTPGGRRFQAQLRRTKLDGSGAAEVLWRSAPGTFSAQAAVAGGSIFVAVYNWSGYERQPDGQLIRVDIDAPDAAATPLITGLLVPYVQGADEQYVYFSAQTPNPDRFNELWRIPVAGGSPALVQPGTAEASVDVGQMLIDADTVWWGQLNRGDVYRVDARGGGSAVLTMDAHHTPGLVGDDSHLYFASAFSYDDIGPAAIWRIGRDCPLR